MRPAPSTTSASTSPSCTKPWRKQFDSMPMPTIAPPTVMCLSSGVMSGTRPCGSVWSTSDSKVAWPSTSTVRAAASTFSTLLKALRSKSRRARVRGAHAKRFQLVPLRRLSAPAPVPAPLSRPARASFFSECCLRRLLVKFVEVLARHRVARGADVALGEDDLEEVRTARRRAEHLGAAIQVRAPDAPEALVELLRVERLDLVPVAVEALAPDIER